MNRFVSFHTFTKIWIIFLCALLKRFNFQPARLTCIVLYDNMKIILFRIWWVVSSRENYSIIPRDSSSLGRYFKLETVNTNTVPRTTSNRMWLIHSCDASSAFCVLFWKLWFFNYVIEIYFHFYSNISNVVVKRYNLTINCWQNYSSNKNILSIRLAKSEIVNVLLWQN